MSFDLIVRNAQLASVPKGAPLQDIGVSDGKIAAIGTGLADEGESVDAGGCLVSAGLIETHIHLDKSRILDRSEPSPDRGTDHMKRVAAVKPSFTVEDVYQRAQASLETSLVAGVTHMRTHVELDPNVGMKSFDALEQLAKDYAWGIDLDLCVFLQEGWTGVPEGDANLVEGLERGAKAIGGAPSYDENGPGQIARIFELANEYDVDVDIHLDVGPNHDHLDIYQVCELADKYGWGGRVAVGHGSKYASMPPAKLKDLGKLLADSGVTVTVLPATDLFTVGRHQDHSVMRGVADANALVSHGVNCCLSTNNILNPFTPFGDGSLMRIANMYANVLQRGTTEELLETFAMVTTMPGRLIGREDNGLSVGSSADLVIWGASSPDEAVAINAQPLHGFKAGRRTCRWDRPELNRP